MKARYFIIGLVVLYIIGCKPDQTKNASRLVLLNSYRHNKLDTIDSAYLYKEVKNDRLSFIYKLGTDTSIYSFFKPVSSDSSIHIYGHNCPLVATKTFKIMSHELNVLRYDYDIISSIDEESSFFYHPDYGLLVGFSIGWSSLMFSIEYDNISKILVDSIINDRTGFYLRDYPPLPDSISIEVMDILDIVDED